MSWQYGRQPEPPRPEDLYDLLEAVVRRTPWKDEEERRKFEKLIVKLRAVNLFGYLSTKITTTSGDETE